ncbi:MAG TPA: DUF2244 domain-containing protein [Xanthobacteraceae bacterium]|jgi:uncharacterized membrane protein|nr:DUF2244 domain-containing protein [Xanthobacteraceae bacterium]
MHESNYDPTLFEARLKPHRSLTPQGFAVLMAVLGGISFAVGTVFLLLGAWPVFGFFGLDMFIVWWAFRANFRAARAYEDIHLTPHRLLVRQVSARGDARETEFNPRWVRLEKNEDETYGVTRLALISRGIALVIGAFLPPLHRGQLAKSLSAALQAAKR